jgi:hypothetical protein
MVSLRIISFVLAFIEHKIHPRLPCWSKYDDDVIVRNFSFVGSNVGYFL